MAPTYEHVRQWALALPGTSEVMVEAWGHPTLRVNDKKFAGGGPGLPSVTVKASLEEQAELVARAPETYSAAAYVGRYGWVEVRLATADPEELRGLLVSAWRRTAPKKLVSVYEVALDG